MVLLFNCKFAPALKGWPNAKAFGRREIQAPWATWSRAVPLELHRSILRAREAEVAYDCEHPTIAAAILAGRPKKDKKKKPDFELQNPALKMISIS